jgi:adenosylcobinamide kinase/adenosylcobinamide-phosphate guanylyltransferase
MKQLIIGACRSGKSAYAERCANSLGKKQVYIATAEALDVEMETRIHRHQADRDDTWELCETPIELAAAINRYDDSNTCILIDCLTLWLSNCLLSEDSGLWMGEREKFITSLKASRSDVLLVGNEVGSGIIPMGEINRTFVDENGRLHQVLAEMCDEVNYIVAGLPHTLKSKS